VYSRTNALIFRLSGSANGGRLTCYVAHASSAFVLIDSMARKHMDRHNRPYKCDTEGCKVKQGFTNSFSLTRHQREVHQASIAKRVFCPVLNCRRSAGSGFTRKQNRDEHVRRLHILEVDGRMSPYPMDTSSNMTTVSSPDPHMYSEQGQREPREDGNNIM
jgi:hypothetical protein